MTVLSRIEGVAALDSELPVGLAEGAQVRTPCGPRRVENLRPGDLVVTRRDGLLPVRMIWHRTIAAGEVAADPSLAPVIFPIRSIGPMMPQTPIRLAAAHRVLVPGYCLEGAEDTEPCLVHARDLAGTAEGVVFDKAQNDLSFYSLIFDSHQVFAANGLQVESFLPSPANVCRLEDDERDELNKILPDLEEKNDEYCKPIYPVWEDAITINAV